MSESRPSVLTPRIVLTVYGLMTVGALVWSTLRGHPNIFILPADCSWFPDSIGRWLSGLGAPEMFTSTPAALVMGAAAGLALGLCVTGLSRVAVKHLTWFRRLHESFMNVLGEMGRTEIWVAAAASSIGEEALFRGLLLPVLGLWLSSAIFGAVHLGPGRRFAAWPAMAFVMGLVFGVLALSFGNLAGPVTAHFIINYLNLTELAKSARERNLRLPKGPDTPEPPEPREPPEPP